MRSPTKDNESTYCQYRNKLNHAMRIAKRKHYHDIFRNANNDSKLMWKHINDIIHKGKKDSGYPDYFIENDRVVSDPQSIANSFNNFFCKSWAVTCG